MDAEEFRERGKDMIDYVADYLETIDQRRVFPRVQPGYLHKMIPDRAPMDSENWEDIVEDVERVIMPGITHWHHPHFHAYFPAANSYAAMCGDILSGGIGCIGFSWASSPACTEMEVVMMDWLAKMLKLPEEFLSSGEGGGVIQGTCSESTLISLMAARNKAIQKYKEDNPLASPYEIIGKLVGYYSDQAHSSVERAGLLAMLRLRAIPSDNKRRMRGESMRLAIEKDISDGLIPFFCTATLGTTSSCAFDPLEELGPVCQAHNMWLHVDAAYAGSSFICPEYRHLLNGVEYADSFVFNPHKWLLINFDCSTAWFRNVRFVVESFTVNPTYLKHKHEGRVPDFRHWHIPFGRRFRSLKIWFVLRLYGIRRLQDYIRNHIYLAHMFENLISRDDRFEIVEEVTMGLVCFRLKGDNLLSKNLYTQIESEGRIHLVTSEFRQTNTYFLRFAVCYQFANESHISFAYRVITECADKIVPPKRMTDVSGMYKR